MDGCEKEREKTHTPAVFQLTLAMGTPFRSTFRQELRWEPRMTV
jgi:hypothetical protein